MIESESFARALDTSSEAFHYQVARWRAMSPQQKADLVAALTRATSQFAAAGILMRHPGASPRELFLRLAILRLGRPLALEVYPDAARLSP